MNKLTIELGGKLRTLKFNMLFLEEYQKKANAESSAVSNTAVMMYAGIKAYADITDTAMDCTFEDCFDWAEEMLLNNDAEVLGKILEAYQQSNVYKATEAAKKKTEQDLQTLMHSNGTHSEKSELDLQITTT